MAGIKISNIVKRSISLSPLVNQWAEELAAEEGKENNFSAFIAELVHSAKKKSEAARKNSRNKYGNQPEGSLALNETTAGVSGIGSVQASKIVAETAESLINSVDSMAAAAARAALDDLQPAPDKPQPGDKPAPAPVVYKLAKTPRPRRSTSKKQ